MVSRYMKRHSTSLTVREIQLKIPSTCQNCYYQKVSTDVGEAMEKMETSCTVGGNENSCSHYEKWYGVSLKKKKKKTKNRTNT